MLRCSKCLRRYEESRQKFCPHDGGRLVEVETSALPHVSAESNDGSQRLEILPVEDLPSETNSPLSAANSARDLKSETPYTAVDRLKTGETPLTAEDIRRAPINSADARNGHSTNVSIPLETNEEEIRRNLGVSRFVNPFGESSLETANNFRPRPLNNLPIVENPVTQTVKAEENAAIEEAPDAEIHLVKGRYRIEAPVASDALTHSYLATDMTAPRRVLLTTIEEVFSPDDPVFTQFQKEKVALSHLQHPHIATPTDSGETADGRNFLIREYVESETLRAKMARENKIDSAAAARIVRQIAQGLSEAHNNRILHRDLRPEHIILRSGEHGINAQIADFVISTVRSNRVKFTGTPQTWEAIAYRSPEHLQEQKLSPESDVFSLAAIAFEMLTGSKPFAYQTAEGLLSAQRGGIEVLPRQTRQNLSAAVEEVLSKALSFERAARHHHARDFGEAFFHALETPSNLPTDTASETAPPIEKTEDFAPLTNVPADVAAPAFLTEKQKSGFPLWLVPLAVSLAVFGIAAYWFANRQPETPASAAVSAAPTVTPTPNAAQTMSENLPKTEADSPFAVSAGFTRFTNEQNKVQGKLAEKFIGFTVDYPLDWTIDSKIGTTQANNFLDVGNRVSDGSPIENLLVTWYGSKGTFAADAKNAVFAQVGQGVKAAYAKKFSNYKQTGEGRTVLPESNLEAYEIKFEGTAINVKDENLKIWGKTYLIPVGREGANSGLAVTLLATSLSANVQNIDDVGTKGELQAVLKSLRVK